MPRLKTHGHWGQVQDHHNLCQTKRSNYCRQQGIVFNLIGSEHQLAEESKEPKANKKIKSNTPCISGFALQHGDHAHIFTSARFEVRAFEPSEDTHIPGENLGCSVRQYL